MRAAIGIAVVMSGGICLAGIGQALGQGGGESAEAQQARQNAAAIVQNMGQNMKAQMGYTYQQRVQVAYGGEVKDTILNQISFDASGKPSVMELSNSAAESSGRRLGHRIKEEKEAEVKGDVKALTELAKQYLVPDKEQMETLAKSGVVSYGESDVMLTATDWVQKGDKIVITADSKTLNRKSAMVTTTSNDNPVTINATYGMLDSGLNYLSHYVIDSPNEKVSLTVDTLNFEPAEKGGN